MTFKDRMDKLYQNKVIRPLERRVRAVALTLDAELVETTPVDTGRARANWLPSLNAPDLTIIPPSETGEQNSVKRTAEIAPVLATYKIDDTILITNNLPYIQRLNDGHSQKTSAGFVQAAIQRAKRIIRK